MKKITRKELDDVERKLVKEYQESGLETSVGHFGDIQESIQSQIMNVMD